MQKHEIQNAFIVQGLLVSSYFTWATRCREKHTGCVCEVDQPAFVTSNWCLMMMPPSRHFWVDDFQLLPFDGDMMGICDLPAWRVFFLGSLLLHVHSFKCHTLHLSRLLGWMVALWLLRPCRVAQLACLRCCRPIVVRNMSTCVALCDGMALKGDKTICWGLCFARFFPYCFMVDILNDSQVDVEDVNSWSTLWYRRFYRGVE